MTAAPLHILSEIHWSSLLWGAFIGAVTIGLRTVMQAPIKALSEHSFFIQTFWWLSPQRPFAGTWEVSWNVQSTRLHNVNSDQVKIRSLFRNVTFTTKTTLKDGAIERCVFVGKLVDRTLTGRWFNPKDIDRAYFGVFQFRMNGGLHDAAGMWMGWTNDGDIQSDALTLKKVA